MSIYRVFQVECDGWVGSDLDGHECYSAIGGFQTEREVVEYLRSAGYSVARYTGGYRVRCPKHRRPSDLMRKINADRVLLDVARDAARS